MLLPQDLKQDLYGEHPDAVRRDGNDLYNHLGTCFFPIFLSVISLLILTVMQILKNIIILPVVEDTAYTDYAAVVMFQMTVS